MLEYLLHVPAAQEPALRKTLRHFQSPEMVVAYRTVDNDFIMDELVTFLLK